jgi:nitroreductase
MDVKEALRARRAVNFFDPGRPVSRETLDRLVELAALAPSGFNLQPWSLILVTSPERKAALRKLAWDQPKITDAPAVFIVLADREAWREGHPGFERNFKEMAASGAMGEDRRGWFANACKSLYGQSIEHSQAFACKNAGFFAMSLMLAATELGLDSHPMDGFDQDGVRREFAVPESCWAILLLAVGYFDRTKTLAPPKWRKTAGEIVLREE